MKLDRTQIKALIRECIVELRESTPWGGSGGGAPAADRDDEDQFWADVLSDLTMPDAQLADAIGDLVRDDPELLQLFMRSLGDPNTGEDMDNESKREARQDIIDKLKALKDVKTNRE